MNRAERERDRERKRLTRKRADNPPVGEQLVIRSALQTAKDYSLENLHCLVGEDCDEIPDDIILAMLNLMQAYHVHGDTLVGHYTPAELLVLASQPPDPSKHIPFNKNCILIHHITNHWVTSYYKSTNRQLILYDSLQNENHLHETKKQLLTVYDDFLVNNIKYPAVKQQNVLPICGAMAIAYSVSLFLGQNPEYLNYDVHCVRQHIRQCLSTGKILPFPLEQIQQIHGQEESRKYQSQMEQLLGSYFEDQKLKQTVHSKTVEHDNILLNIPDRNNKPVHLMLRNRKSAQAIERNRELDRERKKMARNQRSAQDIQTDQHLDRQRKKTSRTSRAAEMVTKHRLLDKERKRSSRAVRSTHAIKKEIDKQRKKHFRDVRAANMIEKDKTQDKQRKKISRDLRPSHAVETDRDVDKSRKKKSRDTRTADTIEKDKNFDKQRKKRSRDIRSFHAVETHRHLDKCAKKKSRDSRTFHTIEKDKNLDKHRKKISRDLRSSHAVETDRDVDKCRKKKSRDSRTANTIEKDRNLDKHRKKRSREDRSSEDVLENNRLVDKKRKKTCRELRSTVTIEKDRHADKVRKKTSRLIASECYSHNEQNTIASFKKSIDEGPTYICACCWRSLYRKSVIHLNSNKYDKLCKTLFDKIFTDISTHTEWICHTCHKKLLSGKLPPQAQINNMSLTPIPAVLKELAPLELQLILKIIPFMKIVAMPRGAQHGLHGQVVLVPADLNKVTTSLPRPSNESQIITLALKRRLSDKHSFTKQYIRPEYVTNALAVLKEINPLYKDVEIRHDWVDVSLQQDPDLWKTFTQSETCDSQQNNETVSENQNEADNSQEADGLIDSEDEVEEDNPQEFITDLQYSRSINTQTCIQPMTGPEIKTNEILNIAPGEGRTPVSMTKEHYWETMAFPNLFPDGKNTFYLDAPRPTKITPKQYINARLLCKDGRFAESPEYAFSALDWLERDAISQNISITTRKLFNQAISVRELKDPNRVSRLLSDNQLFTTFRSIRGSPQYFKQMHLDMMAKLRQLGPYTFFITGSAAEFHWPQVIRVVAQQYQENLTDTQIASMDWQTKRMWLQRNPVTAARQIDHIFEQLWGKVILSGLHPIGQVLNYDLRKEMQGRGTAHFHAAVHVCDAPKLDIDSDSTFTAFADKYIKCELPDKDSHPELYEMVSTRQCHHHTRTCKKNKGCSCRFGFPKCPSEHTVLSRVPTEENANTLKNFAMDILSKMYKELSSVIGQPPTLDSLLEKIGVTKDVYNKALTVSYRRTQVIMKRSTSDIYINNYNPTILKCLQSNMDIQIITSIWACIAYITSYICKPEKTMSELMPKASKEANDKTIRDKLFSIGNVLRKGREVSHHEAIMKILSIPLRRSNLPVQFIAKDYKQDRTRILKPKNVINSMTDDDTDIYIPGIHEKYAARPKSLQNISLAEFVANYTPQSKISDSSSFEQEEVDTSTTSSTITLSNGLSKLSKRNTPQVIRYHFVSKEKDEELYYHRLLLLYLPWQDEDDLLVNGTYKALFEQHKNTLIPTIQQFEPYYEDVETVLETFDPTDLQAEIWDDIANQIQQDKDDPNNKQLDPTRAFLDTQNLNDTSTTDQQQHTIRSDFTLTAAPLMTDTHFYSHVRSLNQKQRHLFDFVLSWATDIRHQVPRDPFYIFLSGGAGVGKSHIIHAIFEAVTRTLRLPGHHPNQPTVLLTASTGKAAANINGLTLHSAFGLPVKDKANKKLEYHKPGAEKLNTLRSNYSNLRLIVADEISMFGAKNLSNLSLALQNIFQEYSLPFAGLSILAVGDLLQLNPVGDRAIFKPVSDGYEALAGSLWTQLFKLYELEEIMRQKNDPCFAQILSRIRTGEFTDDDEKSLIQLEHTDTNNFGPDSVHIYMYNKQVDSYNQDHVKSLNGLITIQAVDSWRDKNTNTVPVTIPDTNINNTANLPKELTVAPGAKVMLTKNIDTADYLVNGVIGKVVQIHITDNKLKGTIYVDFGDGKIGQVARASSPKKLKHCVPIKAVTCTFMLTKPCTIAVERTMFPLILAYAITSHKSQGGTYVHVVADLAVPEQVKTVFPGQVYTILSRATTRQGLKLMNFDRKKVIVNNDALNEMKDMRLSRNFDWTHPVPCVPHTIAFLNIRSLPAHHDDLQTDPNIQKLSVLCLSETRVTSHIEQLTIDNFDSFFTATPHGLEIFVKHGITSTHFQLQPSKIEIMARLVQLPTKEMLVVCVYKPPTASTEDFMQELSSHLEEMSTHSVLLGGDFNMDPRDNSLLHMLERFNFLQVIDKPTHTHGRMLDHIYMPRSSIHHAAGAMPLPYTDHHLTWIHI